MIRIQRLFVAVAVFLVCGLAVLDWAPTLTAATVDPHAYFNALVGRADLWKSFSLRDQNQLLQYRASDSKPPSVTYLPDLDDYPYPQDAAKVVIPGYDPAVTLQANSIANQVWLPMGTENGHIYVATWDAWFGDELRRQFTDLGAWKTFQFDAPRMEGGLATIWFEVRTRFDLAPTTSDIGAVDARGYSTPVGPNVTDRQPLTPAVGTFVIKPRTWLRYWVRIEQNALGWDLMSLWVADEQHDAVQLIDRLEFEAYSGIKKFRLEYNTSLDQAKVGRGPLVSYVRNFAVLKDPLDLQGIFKRPLAGVPDAIGNRPGAPKNVRILRY